MKKFSLKNKLENDYSSVIHVAKWLDFVPFRLQLKKKKKKKTDKGNSSDFRWRHLSWTWLNLTCLNSDHLAIRTTSEHPSNPSWEEKSFTSTRHQDKLDNYTIFTRESDNAYWQKSLQTNFFFPE